MCVYLFLTDGFHKIVSVDAGSLKQECDEIKFKHPFFVRGHPYLLEHIKRKVRSSSCVYIDIRVVVLNNSGNTFFFI